MAGRISKELVAKRRDIIASLLARGMRQSEIVAQLGAPNISRVINGEVLKLPNPSYMVNPKTDDPFDKATISRDTKFLREQWQAEAQKHADEHFTTMYMRLEELYRVNWAAKDRPEILKVIALQIKLLGVAKPEKKELRWDDDQLEQIQSAGERVRDKLDKMRRFSESSE